MPLNNFGLGMVFQGRDQVTPVMKNIRRQFGLVEGDSKKLAKTVGSGFVMLATGAITAGAGMATLSGALNLANEAGAFEQQLAKAGAISRATAAEMKLLENAAIDAGIATQFDPTQAAEGLTVLGTMGFNTAQQIKTLVPALDLAAGGQISVAQAAQTTASALRIFGLEADQATITTDKLLRISNATALQAGDLQLALGTVARGAVLAKQSIDEMLPSIGLIKNTGVDASVAASATSSALIFMAKNAKKFKEIGVAVTDAKGEFRPFMDIVMDTSEQLEKRIPNAAAKAEKAQKLFGRFGIAAYAGISKQLETGIRDATGKIYKGADAVAYLRKQMKEAAGAAAEFRAKLLETWEGQKVLLAGSVKTFRVLLGKSFAKVLKPLVTVLLDGLNKIIRFFKALPEGTKKLIAGLVLAVGALAVVLGTALVIAGGITLLLPFMSTFVMVLGAMAYAAGIVALVLAGFAAAVALAAYMIRNNIGGLGDMWKRFVDGIKLLWNGLTDLFSKGGFSEAISKEMSKAENKGIRKFVITIYMIFYRIKRFFEGIKQGFTQTMEAFSPVFGGLGEAIRRLMEAFSELGFSIGGISGVPSDRFNEAGAGIGYVIASFFSGIAMLITGLIEFFGWLVKIGSFIGDTFAQYMIIAKESTAKFVDVLKEVWDWLVKIGEKISESTFGKLFNAFLPEVPRTAQRGVGAALINPNEIGNAPPAPGKAASNIIAPPISTTAPTPSVAVTESTAMLANLMKNANTSDKALAELKKAIEKKPTIVTLNIDGSRVGEAVARAERSQRARAGQPVAEE